MSRLRVTFRGKDWTLSSHGYLETPRTADTPYDAEPDERIELEDMTSDDWTSLVVESVRAAIAQDRTMTASPQGEHPAITADRRMLPSNDDLYFANKTRWTEMRGDMAECLHVSRSSRHPRSHPYGKAGGTPNACEECIADADMMVQFAHSDRYPAPAATPAPAADAGLDARTRNRARMAYLYLNFAPCIDCGQEWVEGLQHYECPALASREPEAGR